jgi:hypothetical protein
MCLRSAPRAFIPDAHPGCNAFARLPLTHEILPAFSSYPMPVALIFNDMKRILHVSTVNHHKKVFDFYFLNK